MMMTNEQARLLEAAQAKARKARKKIPKATDPGPWNTPTERVLPSASRVGEVFGACTITAVERGEDAKGNHRVFASFKCSCGRTGRAILSAFTVSGKVRCGWDHEKEGK